MGKPLLTVVTVTFRDLPGLRKTLDTLAPLVDRAGEEMECLVQDGGTEGIQDVVAGLEWVRLQSARDGGIYEGMNNAIARSTGEFIWFLNGGDVSLLGQWDILADALREHRGSMLMCNYSLDFNGTLVPRTSRPLRYIWHALPTSHQAIFYPGDILRREGYDLSYRIVGDYALTARLIADEVRTVRLPLTVAAFGTGGTSQQHAKELAAEARRAQQEILHVPRPVQLASSTLHRISRWRRDRATQQ